MRLSSFRVARVSGRDAMPQMPPPNPFAPRTYGTLEAVTDRVHCWRNIVNSAVFVGDRGVAVVDTQVNTSSARRLCAEVQRAFNKPILYAINTHYHWDHAAGNAVFKAAGAQLVASQRTARALRERMPRQKDFLASRGFELGDDPLLPDIFAEATPEIDLGNLRLHLSLGHDAETADPTLVWCPQEKILAAGDTVMTGSFPIFGQPSQREGLENEDWIAALDEVRAFGATAVIPGHGPVAHEAELQQFERIMRYFLDEVRRHHQAGHDLAATIRTMEDDLPAWITRIPEVWGTPRYAILRVWAGLQASDEPGFHHFKPTAIPRTPIDPPAVDDRQAWEDMIAHCAEGGDVGQAVDLAEAACARFPAQPWAHVALARTMIAASRGIASVLEKGDCFHRARTAIATALRLQPGYGPAWLQEGQFLTMMAFRNGEDPDRGEAALTQAAAGTLSVRERAEVAFYQGIAARARGDETAAKAGFAAATRADPGFMPAMLALATTR